MTEGSKQGAPGWLQLGLLALLFGGPLVLAIWLYQNDSLRPAGRTNHGALLEPIISVPEILPNSPVVELSQDHWLLVYANEGECAASCRDALYTLRQSRLMLGNEMHRLVRVFLHGQLAPDRVFIEEQHAGLRLIEDEGLGDLLAARRPPQLPAGGFFLVDPLGNLVMYFPPDIAPGDMVEDIDHLLELSRIG